MNTQKNNKKYPTVKQKDMIVEKYNTGSSLSKLETEFGFPQDVIRRVIVIRGLEK